MGTKISHCNICNVDVSSSVFSRHFKYKKHLQNEELYFNEIKNLKSGPKIIIFKIITSKLNKKLKTK